MNQNPGWLPAGKTWPGSEVHASMLKASNEAQDTAQEQPGGKVESVGINPEKYFEKNEFSVKQKLTFLSSVKVEGMEIKSTDRPNESRLELKLEKDGKKYLGVFTVTHVKHGAGSTYKLECDIQNLSGRPLKHFHKERDGYTYAEQVDSALILAITEAFGQQAE